MWALTAHMEESHCGRLQSIDKNKSTWSKRDFPCWNVGYSDIAALNAHRSTPALSFSAMIKQLCPPTLCSMKVQQHQRKRSAVQRPGCITGNVVFPGCFAQSGCGQSLCKADYTSHEHMLCFHGFKREVNREGKCFASVWTTTDKKLDIFELQCFVFGGTEGRRWV